MAASLLAVAIIWNQVVETVKTYKLLGVTIREDLKWKLHVDCIIARAAKRLYALTHMTS